VIFVWDTFWFLKICAESTDKEFNVQIVFHGTQESNIESILSKGLDPSLRKGQSYGQESPLLYCYIMCIQVFNVTYQRVDSFI